MLYNYNIQDTMKSCADELVSAQIKLEREEGKNKTAKELLVRWEIENEELENKIDELQNQLKMFTKDDSKTAEKIKRMIEDELKRLEGLQMASAYKYDPKKLKVHLLPPRTAAPIDPETIEFRLLHPELIDFSLVGINVQQDGCDAQIYQQLQYPTFDDTKTTHYFKLQLSQTQTILIN